jgi:hypothetical protein
MDKNYIFKIGRYFEYIQEYDSMITYYLKGVELKDKRAMFCLARYYQNICFNIDNMLKYYLLAIELNCDLSMNALGNFFGKKSKYDLFKKYHEMAIKLGNKDSMNELAFYYQIKENNVFLMKKYYIMGAKLNYAPCICNLGRYYQSINQYYKAILLYKLAIKFNSKIAEKNLNRLNNHCNNNNICNIGNNRITNNNNTDNNNTDNNNCDNNNSDNNNNNIKTIDININENGDINNILEIIQIIDIDDDIKIIYDNL